MLASPSPTETTRRQKQLSKLRRTLHKTRYTGAWVQQACPHPDHTTQSTRISLTSMCSKHCSSMKNSRRRNHDIFVQTVKIRNTTFPDCDYIFFDWDCFSALVRLVTNLTVLIL
ncbi:hypothetical protein JTE90_004582 [Oedothorax gibbosus]|uniref:Uncharacterized protein n=1 Tax=Oedothorax gibbosus TaxID=931172 RepID=A0AAV6UJW8_9ARAC|nr:hypothetical protein JTE90_004582 [Oedothorax gibbosus]